MDQRAAQFDEYLRLYTRGLKAEAKAALQEFIEGFSGLAEKIAWTDRNFDTLVHNRHARIRHELYESVVFPALLHGFEADDPQAKFRLAASEQNLLSAQHLHAKIGYRSGLDLLTEAYTADPKNEQYQDALLRSLLADFGYLDHEWPAGILLNEPPGGDGWAALHEDIRLARKLDRKGRFGARLDEFETRVSEYLARSSGDK